MALILLLPLLFTLAVFNRRLANSLTRFRWRLGLGGCPELRDLPDDGARIWIHAASVGEAASLPRLVKRLRESIPDGKILVSVTTQTGMRTAQAQLKEAERLFYLPLDLPWAARRLARLIKARLFITVETELWPNFLRQAKKNGARLMMANGRVSPRSYKTYRHLRPFFRRVLADYDRLNMIGPEDAERIIAMGADPDRVSVAGNVKFDRIADDVHPELAGAMRAKLGLARDTRLLVAGSTRPGEEEQILRAYRILLTEHPDLRLIIAPRHIERAPAVAALAEEAGFKTVLRSEPTPPLFPAGEGNTTKTGELPVIILDTMGELFAVYGLASLAFCGGSLVPLGGQNPLEPAAWGKTVLFGPSMEDFREAGELLAEAGAGFTVRDAEELAAKAAGLLDDPEGTTARGEAGRRAILAHGGASERNVAAIRELLQNN